MSLIRSFVAMMVCWCWTSIGFAQFDAPDANPAKTTPTAKGKTNAKPGDTAQEKLLPRGPQLDTAETQLWTCGVSIRAVGGPCAGLFGTIAVPTDWPEQSVKIFKEDISDNSVKNVKYRVLDGGVKQMLITVPQLAPGEAVKAMVTFEVTRHSLKVPPDTSIFVQPEKMPLTVKKFLAPSPLIECTQPKIKKTAEELIAGKTSAWERVQALYEGTRAKVKWENGPANKGAVAALNDASAQKEDITGVFVALCRSVKIPARMVWIPDSCYAEFYLEDAEGNGYWIPCYLASDEKEFGFVSTHLPILQKGDNFKAPEKKEAMRFVSEFLTGKGSGKPAVEFVRRVDAKP